MRTEPTRKPYPSDISDEEWAFVAPYLALIREDSPPQEHSLRAVINGLRWMVRTGAQWRQMPHDLPPWAAIYQQSQRWLKAGVFEAMVDDLRALLRLAKGREAEPSAVILDARTLQSTPESGARAGSDGHKQKKGSKMHLAVDTLGHLLALHVTPANEQERTHVAALADEIQEITEERRGSGLRRSGLHGRRGGPSRRPARDSAGGREAYGSEARLRAPAQAMGRGEELRLDGSLPTARPRL